MGLAARQRWCEKPENRKSPVLNYFASIPASKQAKKNVMLR